MTPAISHQPWTGGHSTRSEIDIDSDDDTESEEWKERATRLTAIVTVIEAREIRN